jgi:hypothetical protein
MSEQDRQPVSPERRAGPELQAAERSRELAEKAPEAKHDGEKVEVVRRDIESAFKKETPPPRTESESNSAPQAITRQSKAMIYRKTMRQVQSEMTPVERVFSKAIHNPAVEKTSETLGSTVARPNAILAGSVAAFVAVLALYWLAKNYGYQLSGFETIATFIIGWVLGVLYDFFRVMVTGKRS